MTKPLHNQRIVFHDCPDNLFVRLHARAVTELTGETSAEDFLPLAISVEDRIIYTSWNGGLAKTEGMKFLKNRLLYEIQAWPMRDSVWKQIVTTTEHIMWRYNTVAFLLRPKLCVCS